MACMAQQLSLIRILWPRALLIVLRAEETAADSCHLTSNFENGGVHVLDRRT